MKHIGGISDPGVSHVKNLASIGREIQAMGHRFTLFESAAVAKAARAEDLPLQQVGPAHGQEHLKRVAQLSQQQGVSLSASVRNLVDRAEYWLTHGLEAVRAPAPDLLVIDQEEPGAASVADALGIPYVTFQSALPLNDDPLLPPPFLPWNFSDTIWAKARNRGASKLRDWLLWPVFMKLNAFRRAHGLEPYRSPQDSFSRLLQFTQMVPLFDFPWRELPDCYHYVGPYERRVRCEVEFPWGRLDGRPLVYASLGNIYGDRRDVWTAFASACAEMKIQAVISLGRRAKEEDYRDLPEDCIVVSYAPQLKLLERASLVFTHAGLNTTMEALEHGVPLVAMPIALDQPGVAARVARCGAGEVIQPSRLSVDELRGKMQRVLNQPAYRQNARRVQEQILATKGSRQAAELTDQVVVKQVSPRSRAAHA